MLATDVIRCTLPHVDPKPRTPRQSIESYVGTVCQLVNNGGTHARAIEVPYAAQNHPATTFTKVMSQPLCQLSKKRLVCHRSSAVARSGWVRPDAQGCIALGPCSIFRHAIDPAVPLRPIVLDGQSVPWEVMETRGLR